MVRGVKVGGDYNCGLAMWLTLSVYSASGSVPQEAAVLLRAPQHVAWIRRRASFSCSRHGSQRPCPIVRAGSPLGHHEVHLGPLGHLHRLQFLNWPLGSWRASLLSLSSRRLLWRLSLVATAILAWTHLFGHDVAVIPAPWCCWKLPLGLLCGFKLLLLCVNF